MANIVGAIDQSTVNPPLPGLSCLVDPYQDYLLIGVVTSTSLSKENACLADSLVGPLIVLAVFGYFMVAVGPGLLRRIAPPNTSATSLDRDRHEEWPKLDRFDQPRPCLMRLHPLLAIDADLHCPGA
ncbi:hypothetical protein ACG873_03960 [Mesorhizobium sp. AaZ16]